jgi:hypothetical protein
LWIEFRKCICIHGILWTKTLLYILTVLLYILTVSRRLCCACLFPQSTLFPFFFHFSGHKWNAQAWHQWYKLWCWFQSYGHRHIGDNNYDRSSKGHRGYRKWETNHHYLFLFYCCCVLIHSHLADCCCKLCFLA